MQLRLPWTAPARAAARPRLLAVAGRTFPVVIARHRRARRYVLRVTPRGELRVTVPRGASIAGAFSFAARESAWIAGEWTRLQARAAWGDGARVWCRGQIETIACDGSQIRCGSDAIARRAGQDVRAALQAHWRAQAVAGLPARCGALAACHGLQPLSVRVRDQQSRWGACSGRGAITLNWRLVQMPAEVADYVMLHELAHLRQANHSRRFWRVVASLCPWWQSSERWLKQFGRELL